MPSDIEKKYKSKVNSEEEGSKAWDALFNKVAVNPEEMRSLMSDLPPQMVPMFANQITMEEATNPKRNTIRKPLSKIWREAYTLHRPAINRGARNDALAIGQSEQEEKASLDALKD
jgi:hypothetical protein